MKVRHIRNSIIPKILDVSAITIYPFIFYAGKAPAPWLVKHELCHIDQVRKVGWISFYLSYVLFYFANRLSGMNKWQAYRQIPYEIEARQVEHDALRST